MEDILYERDGELKFIATVSFNMSDLFAKPLQVEVIDSLNRAKFKKSIDGFVIERQPIADRVAPITTN